MNLNDLTWWGFFVLVVGAIQPEAAAGAVCGGMFFWALSPEIPVSTRIWLALASIGFGYGIGLPATKADTGWAWFHAGCGATLAHVVIVSLRSVIKTDSPLPPWLTAMLDYLPWRKSGGDNNES